jgi:aryl-alcohol dehydrogenase-like predicted oxidoreductase
MLSSFAFGTYRTTIHNPIHQEALHYALERGIVDIDTSSNYMYGEAEELIGATIKDFKREDISIVSKGGYIQGPNLQRVQEGWSVEDLVEYDPSCFHSISPMFLKDQIERSLERLQSDTIDTYLLHNPEYYLMTNIKSNATDEEIDQHQAIMQERIQKAFEFLEEMVKEGKIKSYGISSNSFAKKPNDYHFLDYSKLIEYAKTIAGEAHHFKVIQLPLNMYEKDGVPCAKWANENGLQVHVNRPLNAFYMGGMLRLASYDKCGEFEELLKQVESINNPHLQGVIKNLIENQHRFGFAGDVDDTIEYHVIPYIISNIKLEPQYFELVDSFLKCYKANVKNALSSLVAQKLSLPEPIDKTAIEYLQNKHYIDKILVGMRCREYVDKICSYA